MHRCKVYPISGCLLCSRMVLGTGNKMENCAPRSEFITVLGMPTSVIKYGDTASPAHKTMFLVIPGNPGVIQYYAAFMEQLYELGGGEIPVWGVSHAGHVPLPPESDPRLHDELCYKLGTPDGQTRHKTAFVKENIPLDVRLFLIGHSIGCYIILHMLAGLDHQVERCFQLFPTIERMAVSPNGLVYTPVLKYLRWLGPVLAMCVTILPDRVKDCLIRWHFRNEKVPSCIHKATMVLIHPFSVWNSLFMAYNEMKGVKKLDVDVIRENLSRLSFYFGQTDNWCPQEYYRDLKALFPQGDIRLCKQGYSHAFVMDASFEMADIVWQWAKPYL